MIQDEIAQGKGVVKEIAQSVAPGSIVSVEYVGNDQYEARIALPGVAEPSIVPVS